MRSATVSWPSWWLKAGHSRARSRDPSADPSGDPCSDPHRYSVDVSSHWIALGTGLPSWARPWILSSTGTTAYYVTTTEIMIEYLGEMIMVISYGRSSASPRRKCGLSYIPICLVGLFFYKEMMMSQ